MNLTQAMSAPIKLENARQIVLNENSYIVRRVGDWSAMLDQRPGGLVVEFWYKDQFLANHVFGQLQSAVDFLNSSVKEVVNNRKEDALRRN